MSVRRAGWAAALIAVAVSATACGSSPASTSSPTTPSSPPATTPGPAVATVSGTVYIHEGGVMRPFAGAKVGAWFESPFRGGGLPGSVADVNGHYVLRAEVGLRVKVMINEPSISRVPRPLS